MLLKDVLFSQGFGTRYDCAAMVASGAVEIAAEVHDDPDEDVETEGLVFRCLGTDWPYFEKAIIALNKPAGYKSASPPQHAARWPSRRRYDGRADLYGRRRAAASSHPSQAPRLEDLRRRLQASRG